MPFKPLCDLCSDYAEYDAKTNRGPWAMLCQKHFDMFGVGLGLGKGQKLSDLRQSKDEKTPSEGVILDWNTKKDDEYWEEIHAEFGDKNRGKMEVDDMERYTGD